ncbi:hypothetical protein Zmor_015741 [Zophobas morio]|uniref:Odorant receptor n=1 Tax=Zophobas morio TaxID=2755281 RepID=A0AA38IKD2_9CUCU|nr:hypothetical protein Zmor_015741 [Zophobas morio]
MNPRGRNSIINPMTDDCLNVVKFISSDILQFKLIKICFWISLAIHIITNLIQIYFLTSVYDNRNEIILYAAVFFSEFYPMLAIGLILYDNQKVSHLKDELYLWAINSAGEKIASKIRKEANYLSLYCIMTCLTAVGASVLFVMDLPHDLEWFFVLRFLQDYLPEQFTVLALLYKTTFFFTGYSMIVHALQVIYYTQHLRYQIMMLNEYIMDLSDDGDDEELFHDKHYQSKVEKKLKFCIKRWDAYLAAYKNKVSEISNMIIGFSLSGWLLGISVVIVMLSGKITPEYYPRQAAVGLAATLTFCCLIESCQTIETQMQQMALVINKVKWYTFNKNNQKLYLILCMNLMVERKIQFSEKYSINYQLGLAIVRGIYSIGTIFGNMNLSS